jgi:hypothetical protein
MQIRITKMALLCVKGRFLKTIKMVPREYDTTWTPNLKVGENERLSFRADGALNYQAKENNER